MLAWLISLILFFTGMNSANGALVVASGLFAIAGNISWSGYNRQSNQGGSNQKSVPGKPEM